MIYYTDIFSGNWGGGGDPAIHSKEETYGRQPCIMFSIFRVFLFLSHHFQFLYFFVLSPYLNSHIVTSFFLLGFILTLANFSSFLPHYYYSMSLLDCGLLT
jgi:hypothetical protein